MKKVVVSFLVLTISLVSFCSCSEHFSHYKDELFISSRKVWGEVVTEHEAVDLDLYSEKNDDLALYEAPPNTYEDVMAKVGEKGLVVAGRAHGSREGHYETGVDAYTLTSFTVEHVFYGETDTSEIEVVEGYAMIEEEGKTYCYVPSGYTTKLKNDQLVLLYLAPSIQNVENQYYVAYPQETIELQEGYLDYSEDYIDRFCAYYKGDRSVYQYPERTTEKITFTLDSGTKFEETLVYFDEYWPQRDLSNEALLEELSQHEDLGMMIQTIQAFQVRIWPRYHVENPVDPQKEKQDFINTLRIARQQTENQYRDELLYGKDSSTMETNSNDFG